MSKTYRGMRHADAKTGLFLRDDDFTEVWIDDGQGDATPLNPRYDLRNHSPTGLFWGYEGSGPAQCALAILADATCDGTAERLYQFFKRDVIAKLPMEQGWVLSEREVLDWVAHADGGLDLAPYMVVVFQYGPKPEAIGKGRLADSLIEATAHAKEMLAPWMQAGDRLEWSADKQKAYIIGGDGEPLDIFAVIQEAS